jgi:tRNA nucleotidyltransferase (CCA-adding enzyme)
LSGGYKKLNATEMRRFQTIPVWVRQCADTLLSHGFHAYLVGGAVRDLLQGSVPLDWDLATDALPEEVERAFPRTVPTGKLFGTITVITAEGPLEVTTLREDLGYDDGRRPNAVRFGKELCLDLARRDFTINAIAYDFASGSLIDPFQGRRDLKRRRLRAVGDPRTRFGEDELRVFRFYRFLATLDLKPSRATQRAILPQHVNNISRERVRDELSKLVVGAAVRKGLEGLARSGLLGEIIPELKALLQHEVSGSHHRWSLWEHTLLAVEAVPARLELRLAALLHDIGKPASQTIANGQLHYYGHDQLGAELSRNILTRLRFPKKLVNTVSGLVKSHMFTLPPYAGDSAARRLIARVGTEHIRDLLELRRADLAATGRVTYQTWENWRDLQLRIEDLMIDTSKSMPRLAINGNDLIREFQLAPGPYIGELLAYLQEQILEDPVLNQRKKLFNLAEKFLNSKLKKIKKVASPKAGRKEGEKEE